MNLPKITAAGALALAATLALASCTSQTPAPAEESKGIELSLAAGTNPTQRALGKIYADQLRAAGYQVTELQGSEDPYQQVLDGAADVAIAESTAAEVEAADNAGANARSLAPSGANGSAVLVMSAAEAKHHSVDSVDSLAAACAELSFIGTQEPSQALLVSLADAGCAKPEVKTVDEQQLVGQLRASLDRVLVLGSAEAIIGDEGFYTVPGSGEIFEDEPVVPLAGENLDEQAQKIVDEVSDQLDQEALIGINRMVSGADALDPETAATRYKLLNN
ncbi:glycine betaine ABC transporter substrate-binding protein [Glutamicibacter arilaitensis]|uniref:glycine betaine ABC transporter substrate-binding protein n=1 Tax=Glutamicibacter arilaitensis TaxID=256701 RepID=UPI0038516EED